MIEGVGVLKRIQGGGVELAIHPVRSANQNHPTIAMRLEGKR